MFQNIIEKRLRDRKTESEKDIVIKINKSKKRKNVYATILIMLLLI